MTQEDRYYIESEGVLARKVSVPGSTTEHMFVADNGKIYRPVDYNGTSVITTRVTNIRTCINR